jgi:hypothetical protein
MDADEQLVFDAEVSAVILGKGPEFVLIPLDGTPTPASLQLARVRGYAYCGVAAYKDGQCSASCERNPSAVYTVMCASFAFAKYVVANRKPEGDGAEWLQALYNLPDTRTGEN